MQNISAKSPFLGGIPDSYINRKAYLVLRIHMTRFHDMKKRSYTHVSVKQQKGIRKAIIRARELHLLPYV